MSEPQPGPLSTEMVNSSSGDAPTAEGGCTDVPPKKELTDIILREDVLYAYEEEAPTLNKRDYMAAIMRSDPRIHFSLLHMGSLRAIETQCGLHPAQDRSSHLYANSGEFKKDDKGHYFFHAFGGQTESKDGKLLLRAEEETSRVLRDTSTSNMRQVIGPDVLFAISGKGSLPNIEERQQKRNRNE